MNQLRVFEELSAVDEAMLLFTTPAGRAERFVRPPILVFCTTLTQLAAYHSTELMQKREHRRKPATSRLAYHISLLEVLTLCSSGKVHAVAHRQLFSISRFLPHQPFHTRRSSCLSKA